MEKYVSKNETAYEALMKDIKEIHSIIHCNESALQKEQLKNLLEGTLENIKDDFELYLKESTSLQQ